ncbi:MAG: phosphatase PAP2 family protein [Elusimicrobia bacterium]|nr:phosphatase PAP2 family protein [Elusimicrobiota bacterium]
MSLPRAVAAILAALLLARPGDARARDITGVREFPFDLIRGVREELRTEGILTFAAAGALAANSRFGESADFDDFRIARTLETHQPLGRDVTNAADVIGYPGVLMAAMAATYAGGWYGDNETAKEAGLLGFEALSLAGIQTLILKVSVDRLRPDETDRQAFPSGHTSASFALASLAGSRWGWKIGLPSSMLAAFVGYTRMERRNHYFSDVIFGAGLGIASGRAVYKGRRNAYPDRYAVSPYVSPFGAGLSVRFR